MVIQFSAIFQFGRWKDWSKDTSSLSGGLLNLAEKLPQMCLNSRADSTRRCYKIAFEKWCKWCVSVKLPVSSINEVFYSISWAHKLAGVYNPCTSDFVLSVKEGVIRTVGHTIHKKSL